MIRSCELAGEPGSVSSALSAAEGGAGVGWQVETSRRYLVVADEGDGEVYVRQNFGRGLSPPVKPFARHPDEPAARVKAVVAAFDSHVVVDGTRRSKWTVTALYGFLPIFSYDPDYPLTAQLEVSIEGIEQQRVVDMDVDGKPVVNSAGVPYDPPVMRDELRCLIRIARNEAGLTAARALAIANTVNLRPWNGLPAKSCKMACPRIVPQYDPVADALYYRVEYMIDYNPDGWPKVILDAGYQWLDRSGTTPRLRNLLDAQGLNITSPGLLDGHGKPLKLPAGPDDVVWNTHDIYRAIDFDALGFPDNIFVTIPHP